MGQKDAQKGAKKNTFRFGDLDVVIATSIISESDFDMQQEAIRYRIGPARKTRFNTSMSMTNKGMNAQSPKFDPKKPAL